MKHKKAMPTGRQVKLYWFLVGLLNAKRLRTSNTEHSGLQFGLLSVSRNIAKQNSRSIISLLLLGLGLTGLQAQSTMYVNEFSGTQTPYALSIIRKLTFPIGNITVNKTSGVNDTYALSDIRYLNFIDLTTGVSQISKQETVNTNLFPNPVNDQLQINFETIEAGNIQVEIVDIQGKVLLQKTISSQNGTNKSIIHISQLAKGIYLCRLQSNTKIETIKFIKN